MIHSLQGAAIGEGMLRGRRCEAHIATLQAEAIRAEGGSTWKEFVICVKLAKRNHYRRNPAWAGGGGGSHVSNQLSSTHLPHY